MSKKLRNKKTGDVGDLLGSCDSVPFIGIMVDYHDGNPVRYEYDSLAELNDEWKDYESKEPLIKNEKIRKAVRAWAEANDLSGGLRVINEHFDCCKIIGRCDSRNVCLEIEFKSTIAHAKKDQFYTITELCGEEEE